MIHYSISDVKRKGKLQIKRGSKMQLSTDLEILNRCVGSCSFERIDGDALPAYKAFLLIPPARRERWDDVKTILTEQGFGARNIKKWCDRYGWYNNLDVFESWWREVQRCTGYLLDLDAARDALSHEIRNARSGVERLVNVRESLNEKMRRGIAEFDKTLSYLRRSPEKIFYEEPYFYCINMPPVLDRLESCIQFGVDSLLPSMAASRILRDALLRVALRDWDVLGAAGLALRVSFSNQEVFDAFEEAIADALRERLGLQDGEKLEGSELDRRISTDFG